MENDLAAVVFEGQFAGFISRIDRPKRKLRQDGSTITGLEVVALPVRSVLGAMPFDQTILPGHAAGCKSSSHGFLFASFDVGDHINLQELFEISCCHALWVSGL